MTRIVRAAVCAWAAIGVPMSAMSLAAPPSVEEVLRIFHENRAKLDPLHVQASHIEERTDAFAKSQLQQAEGIEQLLEVLERGETIPELEKQVPGISSPEYHEVLRQAAETARMLAQSVLFEHRYEFFVDGENYQVRTPLDPVDQQQPFSRAPLSIGSLATDYARTRIYSHAAGRTPPAQVWPGQRSADSPGYAMITSKHIRETQSMRFPAFMQVLHPQDIDAHPIDVFFSAPAERYRVVGEETRDGRRLTIVDVQVPSEQKRSRLGANGEPEQYNLSHWFRAWVDLERGGLPIVLQYWHGGESDTFDESFRTHPSRVTTTTRIERLANGGYYPVRTVEEIFNLDPDTPALSEAEWAEVRTGKREAPPRVVFTRSTWDCATVETLEGHAEDFFVLQFPDEQKYFDLDTGKVVGALESRPAVRLGELAPPWEVGRWLDGKQHALDEFRGKVVVLHFWSLDCSACRNGAPALVAVQQKFADQPVVFVSIHTAERSSDDLAARIAKFASEQDWRYLAAIDAGTMTEDSVTKHAYGCLVIPTDIVIGPDGRVRYTSTIPSPELEGLEGKPCDEVTPEDEAKFEAYMVAQFRAAGETWPLAEDTSAEELSRVFNRVRAHDLSRRIRDVLSETDRPTK